jgi:CHAD domain-containing protein
MRLDPEILDGSPDTGARIVVLARLADAEDALAALEAGDAGGGLPALRGALRRLHAASSLVAPALAGVVHEAGVARLSAIARRAGASRDAEALAAWLQRVRGELPGPYRGALDWLADRVERRRSHAEAAVRDEAARRFRRLAPRLRAELTARRTHGARGSGGATFAAALAAQVRGRTRALRDAVLDAAGPTDAAGLELVRAQAEALRDALEPLGAAGAKAADALRALRPLGELLAEWRDAAGAEAALEAALLEARAEGARRGAAALAQLRPGLLAILRLAERGAGDLRARVAAEHLATRATSVTDAAYAVAAALEARAAGEDEDDPGPPTAPERRFLVTAVPPEGRGGDVEELEQGWLPGDDRDSVGVGRSALGEQWFRFTSAGRGRPARAHGISRAEFEAFWPLTEGRRIAKRRHLVAAAPGWHFDAYVDRPLVLAVAEEGNVEEPPGWLEPVLVREVSSERGYLDEALARRAPRRAG